jgi:dCTP deaminase
MDNAGILSGSAIKEFVEAGRIKIDPFKEERLNPGSYDLTLGCKVAVYRAVTLGDFRKVRPDGVAGEDLYPNACHTPNRVLPGTTLRPNGHLDAALDNEIISYELAEGEGIFLRPGIGYLMHTAEKVWTDNFVPVLDGKSSIGRLFAVMHVTAGYGDANFSGQYTLEVCVTHPLIIYAGMRCCQIRFHTIVGKKDQYVGNYTSKDAIGPVASKAWKQIKDDGLLEKA